MGGRWTLLGCVVVIAAATGAGGGCQRKLGAAPCPCIEGWTCCASQDLCYPAGTGCPGTAGEGGAGGGRDGELTGGTGGGGAGDAMDASLLDAASRDNDGSLLDAASRDGEPADWLTRPEVAPPPSIACGAASCLVKDGLLCCYNTEDQSAYCQGPAAPCSALGTPGLKITLACDGTEDCPQGLICCYTTIYIESFTSCVLPGACVDDLTGRYVAIRRQACDPDHVPSECMTGTCQAAATATELPPNLYLCK